MYITYIIYCVELLSYNVNNNKNNNFSSIITSSFMHCMIEQVPYIIYTSVLNV